jgi:uncharacterized protein
VESGYLHSDRYKPSYYNLVVSHGPWYLLFNGVTSGLMRLSGELYAALQPLLGPQRSRVAGQGLVEWNGGSFVIADLPPMVADHFEDMLKGRFFVPVDEDELSFLQTRYEYCRKNSPFFITITTTMDCNLGCYYCYEAKEKVYLNRRVCDDIISWIKAEITENGHRKLYTDWYGGEPMLNQEIIEYFSSVIIPYCDVSNIQYSSSMISNGTVWPEDASGFVDRNRIRHVQFTLDGPPDQHNKRRRYLARQDHDGGSFSEIVSTIDRLIGSTRIYLRINIDPWVGWDAIKLVEFFLEKGWFETGSKFYPYLAAIGPMTEHCSFLANQKVRDFQCEFDKINHQFQLEIAKHIDPRGIQHLQYYPSTVKINCAAVGDNSVIFGPDGLMYKCGLEVGDSHKAHGRLPSGSTPDSPQPSLFRILEQPAMAASSGRWTKYDPFSHVRCSQCQYLPICMGGCPKAHMDKDSYYLELQSKYWEDNFDTVIRTYYDTASASPAAD